MKPIRPIAAVLATLAMLLAGPAPAQQRFPTPQPQRAIPAPVVAHPALWAVSNGTSTVYLFGTIHLLPGNVEWFDGPIGSALDSSQELVTELPELAQDSTIGAVMKYGTLPPGQSLRAQFTPKELIKYRAAMRAIGVPEAAFDRFKPWYAAVVIATLPLQKKGYDVAHGVEAALTERNKAQGHPRSGLETMDYQLGLFDSLSPATQKRYLFQVIDELPKLDKEIAEMIGAWAKGDPARLAALLNAAEDDPAMTEVLLTRRNHNWERWIETRMAHPGTVFIAVGAGHLGGKGGVPALLAKAGYKVTRVQ